MSIFFPKKIEKKLTKICPSDESLLYLQQKNMEMTNEEKTKRLNILRTVKIMIMISVLLSGSIMGLCIVGLIENWNAILVDSSNAMGLMFFIMGAMMHSISCTLATKWMNAFHEGTMEEIESNLRTQRILFWIGMGLLVIGSSIIAFL